MTEPSERQGETPSRETKNRACAKVLVIVEMALGADHTPALLAAWQVAQSVRFTPGVREVLVVPLPEEVLDVR